MAQLSLRNISKTYGSDIHVIRGIDLDVHDGEFMVFVGPSGCGKSTMMRMIAGLEDISGGDMLIDNERVNDVAPAKRGIAMVFQSYALYPHMTVAQNMAFGLQVLGANAADIDKKVRNAAEILQLTHLLDRLPKALSGGQRQRVAIGRAIVKEPRVFLFDEPLSNLDAALRVQTRLEIAKLHHEIGTASMIYVTHDQVEAMTLADKIVLLRSGDDVQKKGSVAQVGTPMDLYHRPNSLFVAEFIGSPKMNILPGHFVSATPERAQITLAGSTFEVAVQADRLTAGGTIHLGLRPEHMRLVGPDHGPNCLSAQIIHIEKLGESSLLYLSLSEGTPTITLKVEGTTLQQVGENVRVHIAAQDLHLFDAEGEALPRTVSLPAK